MSISKKYSRFQLGYLILTVILIAAAIYLGFNIWGSVIVGLIIWLITSASYPGLEFSPDCRCMRNYYGLLGYKIGRWERLPPIVGVTIKQFSEIVRRGSRYDVGTWGSNKKRHKEIIIMLSAQDSPTGIIIARFSDNENQQAIKFASDIAVKFNVPINNYL